MRGSKWSCSVVVSTSDFESDNPGSNPGETLNNIIRLITNDITVLQFYKFIIDAIITPTR